MGAERKPFHESVVDAIRNASLRSEMRLLATLIRSTNIPRGHEEIAAAWKERCGCLSMEDPGVLGDLEDQRRWAEARVAEKAKAGSAVGTHIEKSMA